MHFRLLAKSIKSNCLTILTWNDYSYKNFKHINALSIKHRHSSEGYEFLSGTYSTWIGPDMLRTCTHELILFKYFDSRTHQDTLGHIENYHIQVTRFIPYREDSQSRPPALHSLTPVNNCLLQSTSFQSKWQSVGSIERLMLSFFVMSLLHKNNLQQPQIWEFGVFSQLSLFNISHFDSFLYDLRVYRIKVSCQSHYSFQFQPLYFMNELSPLFHFYFFYVVLNNLLMFVSYRYFINFFPV